MVMWKRERERIMVFPLMRPILIVRCSSYSATDAKVEGGAVEPVSTSVACLRGLAACAQISGTLNRRNINPLAPGG
jgi:hypothetical protein